MLNDMCLKCFIYTILFTLCVWMGVIENYQEDIESEYGNEHMGMPIHVRMKRNEKESYFFNKQQANLTASPPSSFNSKCYRTACQKFKVCVVDVDA